MRIQHLCCVLGTPQRQAALYKTSPGLFSWCSSELAQLTDPPQLHSCYLGSPPVFWGVLSALTVCSQVWAETEPAQPGLLPAGAPLSQTWRSRREDAFVLQLPELISPHNSLAKVQDGLWSDGSIQVDVKLYLQ